MSRRGRDAMQVAGRVPDNRWTVVAAYCAVSSANQMLWLTFAPITTVAAHHYGVAVSSMGWMGWMANVFPLIYVILALPAGVLLDRWFRGWLAIGALLTAGGGLLRIGAATSASWPASLSSRSLSPLCSTPWPSSRASTRLPRNGRRASPPARPVSSAGSCSRWSSVPS